MSIEPAVVLRYPNGMFVALDRNSGGYPFQVPAKQAHDFGTVEKAKAYRRNENFDIVRLHFEPEVVERWYD